MRGENVTGADSDPSSYRYRICVRGRLGKTICSAFPALQAQGSGGDTVLTGALPDRAALYGVLAEIEETGRNRGRSGSVVGQRVLSSIRRRQGLLSLTG